MEKKPFKLLAILLLGIVVFSNGFVITKNLSSDSNNLDLIIKQAFADGEGGGGGGEIKHSEVVGCGSNSMEDWDAGCCAGIGGCTDNCTHPPC